MNDTRGMAVALVRAWLRHADDRTTTLMYHEAGRMLDAADRSMTSPALTADDVAQLRRERDAVAARMTWRKA